MGPGTRHGPADSRRSARPLGDGWGAAAVRDAVRLAELWLDDATALPSTSAEADAWSRAEWVEATLPVWRHSAIRSPRALVSAMGEAVPAEMRQLGPLLGVMRQMGGAMFGAQVGQAIGELSGEVVGSADIGVPLTTTGRPALRFLPQ